MVTESIPPNLFYADNHVTLTMINVYMRTEFSVIKTVQ